MLRRLLRPKPNAVIAAIVSTSHFGPARTLASGLARAAPGIDRALLWVDAPAGADRASAIRASAFDRILTPEDLLEEQPLASLRCRYTLPEFCFALKPLLLRRLLDEGHSHAVYLDTDLQVYAPLDPVWKELGRHSIALTPHITEPLPEDDHLPRDMTILRAGAFNLGFVGVANDPHARRFLDWWAERESRYGYLDPWRGWGADQRWCDLVPVLFEGVGILKSPGMNVGYWNLLSRPLSKRDGRWYAAGEPLMFFHFSGFDPEHPATLSKFQDRIDPAAYPLLAELLADYALQLKQSATVVAGSLPASPSPADTIAPDAVADAFVGAAMAPENYAVRLTAAPDVVCAEPGEVVLLRITVENPGPHPLHIARHSDGASGIGLTYHLLREDDGLLAWDNPRFYSPAPLPPRALREIDVRYRVPGDPGHFVLEFDLVQEGIGWFHERGGTTARVEVYAGIHRGAR